MAGIKTEDFDKVTIESANQLRTWLFKHHAQDQSVWLITFLKHVEDRYVSRNEVLDVLLCFGWIDGIRRKLNGKQTMQLISPRRTQHWAKSYKDRVAKLTRSKKCTRQARKSSPNQNGMGCGPNGTGFSSKPLWCLDF